MPYARRRRWLIICISACTQIISARARLRSPAAIKCAATARARNGDFSYCFALRAALNFMNAAIVAHGGDLAFGQRVGGARRCAKKACGKFCSHWLLGRSLK